MNDEDIKSYIKKTLTYSESFYTVRSPRSHISYFAPRLKKNGHPGKLLDYCCRSFTPLYICELCKKMSTPKKVQYKYTLGYDYLCIGCWNKLKPIEKKQNEIKELEKLTRKLRKLSTNHRKKQNEQI